MSIICQSDKEYEKIIKLLTSRFMPGEPQKTAIIQLQKEIHRSTRLNLNESLVDFFHYHHRENTISQYVPSTQHIVHQTQEISHKVTDLFNSWWQGH